MRTRERRRPVDPSSERRPEGSNVSEQRPNSDRPRRGGEAHADGLGDGEDDTHGGHTVGDERSEAKRASSC